MFTVLVLILTVFGGAAVWGVINGLIQAKTIFANPGEPTDDHPDIQDFLKYKRSLAQLAVPVDVTDEISDQLTESRLGGRPAWPKNQPRPRAKQDCPLCFLAQINLADMPRLPNFPTKGLLQFYFASDDVYGMGFDNAETGTTIMNSDILVVHHPNLETMEEWVQFHGEDETYMLDTPFYSHKWPHWWDNGFKLSFSPVQLVEPSLRDYRIEAKLNALEQLFTENEKFYERFEIWDKNGPEGIIIGGHPHFTQQDPRAYQKVLNAYSQLLLSIPSLDNKIKWGDDGTGSFLIRPASLQEGKFDDILYNYDCY
jgi:uncharacterized protein YwqG